MEEQCRFFNANQYMGFKSRVPIVVVIILLAVVIFHNASKLYELSHERRRRPHQSFPSVMHVKGNHALPGLGGVN